MGELVPNDGLELVSPQHAGEAAGHDDLGRRAGSGTRHDSEARDLRAAPGSGGGQTRATLVTPAGRYVGANGVPWRCGPRPVSQADLDVVAAAELNGALDKPLAG